MLIVGGLLAACAAGERPMVDVKPVGDGLTFLGMAGVLATLIVVFGKFVSDFRLSGYMTWLLGGLLVLLVLVVTVTAIPALIIPVSIAVAILVIVAVCGRWR